jgi:hypothetical protein
MIKVNLELTKEIIQVLSIEQAKEILLQVIIQPTQVISKVESENIICQQPDNSLNLLETSQIIEKGDNIDRRNEIIKKWNTNNPKEFQVKSVIPEYIKENIESDINNLKSDCRILKADQPIEFEFGFENKNSIPEKGTIEDIKAELLENKNIKNTYDKVSKQLTPTKKLRKAQKPSEFIKNKNGENIPISKVVDLYKNGISLAKICHKYNIRTTTLFSRLDRLGLTVKKKF